MDTLDVLAGFPDVLSEAMAINTPQDAPNSVQKLILTAAYAGYAVIVLDAPPTALAASAISATNTLVLATPTAVVVAIGNAARRVILVKSGAVIEQVGRVNVVALDNTGTFTQGRPAVQPLVPLNGLNHDELLAMAAATERYSEHPIGRSIELLKPQLTVGENRGNI